MTREQLNQTSMFDTVSSYMDQNKTLWQGIPAFVAAVADFSAGNAEIDRLAGLQQVPTTGLTEAKGNVRNDYEEQILFLADQLSALAEVTKDADLAAKTELTPTALDKSTEDGLLETGQLISSLAKAHLAGLADYGITAQDITEMDSLGAQFKNTKTAPRVAIAGRSAHTASLPEEIKAQTVILTNRLDKLMTRFKQSQALFYSGYQSARVIVDRGGSNGKGTPPTPPAPKP